MFKELISSYESLTFFVVLDSFDAFHFGCFLKIDLIITTLNLVSLTWLSFFAWSSTPAASIMKLSHSCWSLLLNPLIKFGKLVKFSSPVPLSWMENSDGEMKLIVSVSLSGTTLKKRGEIIFNVFSSNSSSVMFLSAKRKPSLTPSRTRFVNLSIGWLGEPFCSSFAMSRSFFGSSIASSN